MDSIQLKTKELLSKMYLTQTHWTHKIGSLCGGTWIFLFMNKTRERNAEHVISENEAMVAMMFLEVNQTEMDDFCLKITRNSRKLWSFCL